MSVNYVCKHCHTLIGRLEESGIDETRLGFHQLTSEERQQYILVHSNGDVTVRMTCDYCTEAIQMHPELSLLPSPLQ
ncbi:anti-sigma-F factor Fin family protein [Paenibacillus profundus]|uniref:Anti-sigma-F factor Fin family protein n=1 Tax=Paenibacillus profundus TaxID=1173085 RepID=A0ABS8YKL4_9BACL|nr:MULTISPECIES: anti-sigma-F factor Fin [Paenibacillus]MCE5172413.1 anti-sigma-F factor Fin family protein [Paenibacillus profundus]